MVPCDMILFKAYKTCLTSCYANPPGPHVCLSLGSFMKSGAAVLSMERAGVITLKCHEEGRDFPQEVDSRLWLFCSCLSQRSADEF